MNKSNEFSSFRDSSGTVFWERDVLYRTVNISYQHHYDLLINSGLYAELVSQGLLIDFKEVSAPEDKSPDTSVYKYLLPEIVPFISYPYEWSFSQLKDAALATLRIHKNALSKGLVLKDASAYNIQFVEGNPTLIDILSFEKYEEGDPWHAYGQFCRHFVAPLLLSSYVDPRLTLLLKDYLDGIPLDLTNSILPLKAKTNLLYLMHIGLQAKTKSYISSKNVNEKSLKISMQQQLALIENLIDGIEKLKPHQLLTTWGDYYNITNYTDNAMLEKVNVVSDWTEDIKPKKICDLGGNNGKFSREIKYKSSDIVCADSDVAAIEECYLVNKKNSIKYILPLLIDITNPSGGIGWDNMERKSFISRSRFDLAFALALVHHLAIGNNIPLFYIRDFLAKLASHIIIEFVPIDDSQSQKLLILKKEKFSHYTQDNFERVFSEVFTIDKKHKLKESSRVLYLMSQK